MFKDTCTVGKMLRSYHGIWALLSPASWEARVTNDLWKKRTFIYESLKKKPGENLICVSWLSSNFWLRRHGPFYQVLESGWYWATYSLAYSVNQSMTLLTHSRPKIEFYFFAIAYLPTLFPLFNFLFFFCLSRTLFFFLAVSLSDWNTKTLFMFFYMKTIGSLS